VVDEEDMDGWVAAVDEAIDAERAFAEDGSGNKSDRNDVKFFRVSFTTTQRSARFDLVKCQQLYSCSVVTCLRSTG
jgi:hypothetical protein